MAYDLDHARIAGKMTTHERSNGSPNPFAVGDEVAAGDIPEDYDEGCITAIEGDQVEVAWRGSNERTTQHYSALLDDDGGGGGGDDGDDREFCEHYAFMVDELHRVLMCPLPLGIIQRCLGLWSNEKDVVLSPFAGIGSEGVGALRVGRKFIGVELKGSYFQAAIRNLNAATCQMDLGLQ